MFLRMSVLAAALACAAPVLAQDLVDGRDPQAVLEAVRGYGSGAIETDSGGDPMISGRIEGVQYAIFFYGCTGNVDCSSIQLTSAWVNPGHVTLDRLNDWNRTKRFGTAYLDDENDPVLEMNVNLDGGVSPDNMDDTIDWWRVASTTFRDEVIQQQ